MNALQEILELLPGSSKPVPRVFFKNEGVKIICIGFTRGMRLDQHKTSVTSRLLVLSGQVTYIQSGERTTLKKYDEVIIFPGIIHEVEGDADSMCILIQG